MSQTGGHFIIKLSETGEPEKFGLFSARGLPLPIISDRPESGMTEIETPLGNLHSGKTHNVIHRADAKL